MPDAICFTTAQLGGLIFFVAEAAFAVGFLICALFAASGDGD